MLRGISASSTHAHPGKSGFNLGLVGTSNFGSNIANSRITGFGGPPSLPYAVTEHASHTTANFNSMQTTGDVYFEASRLGSQILFNAVSGFESYIFKYSALEQSSGLGFAGCKAQFGTAGWTTALACGVQKTGLHWAENGVPPFPIGDVTLAGKTASLIYNVMAGGLTLETPGTYAYPPGITTHPWFDVTANKNVPTYMAVPVAVVNDGRRRYIVWTNDGFNPTDAACAPNSPTAQTCYPDMKAYAMVVDWVIAAWGIPSTTTLVHKMTAYNSFGDVATIGNATSFIAGASTGQTLAAATTAGGSWASVTATVPPYSTHVLIAPLANQVQMEQLVVAAQDTTLVAGANIANTYGSGTTISVSTSATATHDTTSVAVLQFTVSPALACQTLTAVLQLTVASVPASDMLMTVIGVNPTDAKQLAWSQSARPPLSLSPACSRALCRLRSSLSHSSV